MTAFKRFVLTSLSLAVLVSSTSVHARAGSSSSSRSSSSSMSSSRSAAPAPRPAPSPVAAPAPQRASAGGMQRSNVMSQARSQQTPPQPVQQAAKAPPPAPSSAPLSSAVSSSNSGASRSSSSSWAGRQESDRRGDSRRGGLTTGQALGAAAAVGVGAYLLGSNASAQTPQPTPSTAEAAATSVQTPALSGKESLGAVAGNSGLTNSIDSVPNSASRSGLSDATSSVASYAAPSVASSASQAQGMGSMMMQLAMLLALGVACVLAYRQFTKGASPGARKTSTGFSSSPSTSGKDGLFRDSATDTQAPSQFVLLQEAPKLFRAVQEANNAGDKYQLATLCDDAYLPLLTDDIDTRTEPSRTHVMSVEVVGDAVLGFELEGSRYVGSVHFRARISEGSGPVEDIQEVWHFVCKAEGANLHHHGGWKLAGIEIL